MDLPSRGSLVVLDTDSQSYTGFFRKMTSDFQFQLYDAKDSDGRYVGNVCLPLVQVTKLLVSDEMSDPESCCSSSSNNSNSSNESRGVSDSASMITGNNPTEAVANDASRLGLRDDTLASSLESSVPSNGPITSSAASKQQHRKQSDDNFGQRRLLASHCPKPNNFKGLPTDSGDDLHGMLYLLPELDASCCALPENFVYDKDFSPESADAHCVLVTTAAGANLALSCLANADQIAMLCHGADLRCLSSPHIRPRLVSVAMPLPSAAGKSSCRVFLFDLDMCSDAAMSCLSRLLKQRPRPSGSSVTVVTYDCRLLRRHLSAAVVGVAADSSTTDCTARFVDLQVLSTSLQQLYSDGKCSHICQGLYKLMRTYLAVSHPYSEPRAREDLLIEDAKVWHRQPLHTTLIKSAYDKCSQLLPLYKCMLDALLNPIYRASKHRMFQLSSSADSDSNLQTQARQVDHRYCNLFAPRSEFLSATVAPSTKSNTVANNATDSSSLTIMRHAKSAAARLNSQLSSNAATAAKKTNRQSSENVAITVSREYSTQRNTTRAELARADLSGLPVAQFCSIPSQAELDQLRAANRCLLDARAGGSGTSSCYSSGSSELAVQQQAGQVRGRGIRRSSELDFEVSPRPGANLSSGARSPPPPEQQFEPAVTPPQLKSSQASQMPQQQQRLRGRCRGSSIAFPEHLRRQQEQQQQQQQPPSPCSPVTLTSPAAAASPDANNSLSRVGFGRGRGSASNLMVGGAGGVGGGV